MVKTTRMTHGRTLTRTLTRFTTENRKKKIYPRTKLVTYFQTQDSVQTTEVTSTGNLRRVR